MVSANDTKILYSNDDTGDFCSFTEATPDMEGYLLRLHRQEEFRNSIEWFDVKNNTDHAFVPRNWEPA
jgi:hypothetical protein